MMQRFVANAAPAPPSMWESTGPELFLLAAGGILTVFLVGVFIFVFTRKDKG